MSETVTGYIDHIIFRNEENGYTVMVLKETKEEEELTCVGSFPSVTQGASIEASGVYTHHPVYGKQFQISSFVEKMPEDTEAMERYLGSGAIKGIGAALAARIVRKFGADTIRIVEEEPERLAIQSFRKTHINWLRIFPESDLRLRMRSHPGSESMQIQITESEAGCCILSYRLRERGIFICQRTSFLPVAHRFWEWMSPIWRNI